MTSARFAPAPSAPLTITHVLASIDDRGAGPSVSVPSLARELAGLGADVEIRTVAGWRAAGPVADVGVPVHRHPASPGIGGRVFAASTDMRRALLALGHTADVIHSHGLWLAPNVYPAEAVRRPGVSAKFVLSPRGMLAPAARRFGAARKAVSWALYQKAALQRAHCLHATAASECEEIRDAGLTTPVAVIPNGVDCPALEALAGPREPLVVSLGRIHPKKGLDTLLRAWVDVERRHAAWRLQISGPSEGGHAEDLRGLARDLDLRRVTISEGVYGAEKSSVLARCGLFVLPSLNENFAMTVAEALSHGAPVIASRGAPWRGLQDESCGWWIDATPQTLAATLDTALALPEGERQAMGARGRAWMERDFSWNRVARDMLDVYAWLCGRADAPATVRFA